MFKRLIFNSEMIDFLSLTSNRINDILIHGDSELISEEGNFIKNEENDFLSYLPKSKYQKDADFDPYSKGIGRVKIKIGRFVRKFISEKSFIQFEITDQTIEFFVNSFKSYFNSTTSSIKIIEGTEILKWYLDENYYTPNGMRFGSLWNSCMRYHDRNKYMTLYAKNPNIKMAVFLVDDKVRCRALLWNDAKDLDGKSYKVMDRIYSVYDHDVILFKNWANENGYISKWTQSAKSEKTFDVGGITTTIDLIIKLENYQFRYYPYLDTFKYYNEYKGTFSNSRKWSYDYILIQSNGSVEPEPEPDPEWSDDDN
jgi:hypothetical protein